MQQLNVHVGEKIRLYRQNRRLTQEQLGEKVDLPQSYIGAIERGERNISLDTLERIVRALEINAEELFTSNRKKDGLEKEKLIDKIGLLLHDRNINEIKLVHNLVIDLIKVFDNK